MRERNGYINNYWVSFQAEGQLKRKENKSSKELPRPIHLIPRKGKHTLYLSFMPPATSGIFRVNKRSGDCK